MVQVSLDLLFLVTALVAPGEYLVNAIARRIGTLYAFRSSLRGTVQGCLTSCELGRMFYETCTPSDNVYLVLFSANA